MVDQIVEQMFQESGENISQDVAGQLQNLLIQPTITAMYKFYTAYSKYYNYIIQKRGLKENKNSPHYSYIKEKIREQQTDVYKLFFEFQNLFNQAFGQEIQIIYTYQDENSRMHLGTMENSINSLTNNQWGKLSYDIQQIQGNLIIDNFDSSSLDDTVESIYERWNIAKGVQKRSTWLPILWKKGAKWEGAHINNLGTINEAYAAFYLHQIVLSGGIEDRVCSYVIDPIYGVMSVDNTLGFFIGDTASQDRKIQYAVKSGQAGPMGMHRVYQYINQIIKDLGSWSNSPQLLNNLKEKVSQSGTVKQAKELTSGYIRKTYQEEIEKILNLTK